jgi:hypothetical protein
MRVLEGVDCRLIPAEALDRTDLDGDSEHRAQGGQLFDLFVPADADNCPHPLIRNRPDGHVTGDLFEEVQPGFYCFRGFQVLGSTLVDLILIQGAEMTIGSGLENFGTSATPSAL